MLGFGLNVQLVFRSALNIVQLFTAAAVVTALNSNLEYRFHKILASDGRAVACGGACENGQPFRFRGSPIFGYVTPSSPRKY